MGGVLRSACSERKESVTVINLFLFTRSKCKTQFACVRGSLLSFDTVYGFLSMFNSKIRFN